VRNRVWRDELALWTDVVAGETRYRLPYLNLGLALADAGRGEEAERAYQQALAARGDTTNQRAVLMNFGHLKRLDGDLDEAERLFTEALAIGPHASVYFGLGALAKTRAHALLEAGNEAAAAEELARAKGFLETSIASFPRHYQSHFTLAGVLYLRGEYEAALEHYRRVVELAGDTDVGRNAAVSVQQLGAWLADPANRAAR
jgi:tetratricopeptide (TPR) repeat protein